MGENGNWWDNVGKKTKREGSRDRSSVGLDLKSFIPYTIFKERIMTEEEREAASLIVDHGKITKLKGKVYSVETGSSYGWYGWGTIVRIEINLDKDDKVYILDDKLPKGVVAGPRKYKDIELMDTEDVKAKCRKAEWAWETTNETFKRWALPGVKGIDDLKKAPREIAGLMMNVVSRITMDGRTADAVEAYNSLKDDYTAESGRAYPDSKIGKSEFVLLLAYDALKFHPADIEDDRVGAKLIGLKDFLQWEIVGGWKDGGTRLAALRNKIAAIEADAIKR